MRNELYDTEGPSWGEHPGELGELQSELAWVGFHKKELLETQKHLEKRIRELESVLWDVLSSVEEDQVPSFKTAWKVLREKSK
jgi:hypothetical protein